MSSQHLKTLTCPPGPCRRPRRSLAERSPRCPPKWRGCLESLARRKAAPEDTERVALYTWITHCESSLKFLSRTKTPTLNLATFSKSSWNTQQQWVIYPFFTTPSSHMQSLFLVIFTAKQWRLIIMWFEKGEEGCDESSRPSDMHFPHLVVISFVQDFSVSHAFKQNQQYKNVSVPHVKWGHE